jgi:phospholipid-binding lipoprotein MlaA
MSLPVFASVLLLTGAQPSPDPVSLSASLEVSTAWVSWVPITSDQDNPAPSQPTPPPLPTPPVSPPPIPPDATGAQTGTTPTDQGDIIVTARPHIAGDPLEAINAASFAATQAVDKAVVAPVSLTFKRIVPTPIRAGLSNFAYNINEIDVFLNFLLQHKIGKAVETAGRFVINTTLGVFGLFDVAKRRPFNLPRRPNGFADTMGFYGVGPGPYLFLPIIGATTVRDLIGRNLDRLVAPLTLGKPFNQSSYTIPMNVAIILDTRSQFDAELKELRAKNDPYAARRTYYLRSRQAEIDHLRGRDQPVPDVAVPLPTPTPLPIEQ